MTSAVGHASVQRLVRLLATAGAALVLVVIVSSAYLRLSQAGLSCAQWPACYGRLAGPSDTTTAQRGARIAHRFAATGVAGVLLALLAVATAQRPRRRGQAAIAGAGLAVAAGLAVIGAVSSEAAAPVPVPAVTIANLGGGFAILALLWWLRQTALEAGASPAAHVPRSPWLSMLATFTLIAVIGQIALGALVSAKFAALACPAFPLCGADAPSGTLLEAFDPFTALTLDDSNAIVRPAALASLQWVHRVGAHVVLVLGTVLAVALIRDVRLKQCGIALVALLVVQLALGAAAVLAQVPLALVLAHNLVAALLLGTLVTINCRLCA